MTSLEKLEKRVIFERLVIGLEEPVLIKGIGEIQAKVDSGNGGYNVLHGTDIYEEGDMLHFTTIDGQGNPKHVATKLIDRLQVNIGGGHIQDRPVVELDIKFANTLYKKIPFSITDRSDNDLKILIAKSFVDDELNALIDVGEVNISKNNVQVDTVNESILTEADKNDSDWKSLNVGAVSNETVAGRWLAKLDSVLYDLEQTSGGTSSQDYNLAKNKFEQLYKKNKSVKLNFNSDYASRFAPQSSSSKTITVKDKETGVAAINAASIDNTDSLIALGFRLKALYTFFLKKQDEEKEEAKQNNNDYAESDDDKKWKKKYEKRIKNAYAYSVKKLKGDWYKFRLNGRKRKFSQVVQDAAKGLNVASGTNESVIVEANWGERGKKIVGWTANKTGLTKAVPAVVSGAGAMVSPDDRSGVLPTEKQNPEHEKYMETLKGAIKMFDEGTPLTAKWMLDIAYGESTKPNISNKESIKKEIENLFNAEKELIKNQKLLDAKMSDAIDSDVKDGFWNSLSDTLTNIADTADQIYRGNYKGSLIGSSVGFLKKWMSGGGLMMKLFKGSLAAFVFVNAWAVLPLTIAYVTQQAMRKAKTKQLNVDENAVNEFKESLNGLAKQAKELSVNTNKEVAEAKNLTKTDQQIISEFMKEDEVNKKLSNAAGEILGKGGDYENPNLGADGLFPVIDYLERVDSKRMLEEVSDFRNFLNVNAVSPQMLEQLKNEDDDEEEAEEDVKHVDGVSHELFEHYSREAYSVLNEGGEPTQAAGQGGSSTAGGEDTQAQGQVVEKPMTEQDMVEVKETAKDHIKTFKEFFEELQRRKKFVLYYIPIEGKNSDAIKEVLKGKSLDEQLSEFYTQKHFSQKTFSATLDTIVKEFNNANGEGVGTLMIVWNKAKNGKRREVVTGLDKEFYLVDFKQGKEKKNKKISKEQIEEILKVIPDKIQFKIDAGIPIMGKSFNEKYPNVDFGKMLNKKQFNELVQYD